MLWKNSPFSCCSSGWEVEDLAQSPQSGVLTWVETDGGVSLTGCKPGNCQADTASALSCSQVVTSGWGAGTAGSNNPLYCPTVNCWTSWVRARHGVTASSIYSFQCCWKRRASESGWFIWSWSCGKKLRMWSTSIYVVLATSLWLVRTPQNI